MVEKVGIVGSEIGSNEVEHAPGMQAVNIGILTRELNKAIGETRSISIGELGKIFGISEAVFPKTSEIVQVQGENLSPKKIVNMTLTELSANEAAKGNMEGATALIAVRENATSKALEIFGIGIRRDHGLGELEDRSYWEKASHGLVIGYETGKLDALTASTVAIIAERHNISGAEAIELSKAIISGDYSKYSHQEHIELAAMTMKIARSIRNTQSRRGVKPADLAQHEIAQLAFDIVQTTRSLSQDTNVQAELHRIKEGGKLPDKITNLTQIIEIVHSNPEIQAVSLDMYDTVVQWTSDQTERRKTYSSRVHKILAARGVNISEAQTNQLLEKMWRDRWDNYQSKGEEVSIESTINSFIADLSRFDSHAPQIEKQLNSALVRSWYDIEIETAAPMPGIITTLEALKARGIKICLTSNASWSRQHVYRVLKQFKLFDYFDAVSLSSEIGKMKKPNVSEFFHYSWDKLGVKPENVLHIGDNIWDDVQGGANAGAKVVLYDNPHTFKRLERDEKFQNDYTLYSETAFAMSKETVDLLFEEWLSAELKRNQIPQVEHGRVRRMAKEVYRRSREIFAPVYIATSEHILDRIQKGEVDQCVSLARDGLPLAVSTRLLRHYERDRYDRVRPDQLKFIHASRATLEKASDPKSESDQELRKNYIEYLHKKGVLKKDQRTLLTDLLCGSGKTHYLLQQLLGGQPVEGYYVESHQPQIPGYLQNATGRNHPWLTVDSMLLHFESLLNGPFHSVRGYETRSAGRGQWVKPIIARKKLSPEVTVRGLSQQSILFMNKVAIKGLTDEIQLHHRRRLLGMSEMPDALVANRFITFLQSAPVDDIRRSIPWEDYGQWYLPSQNSLENI